MVKGSWSQGHYIGSTHEQNYNYVPYTAVVSNVKESWSQGYYVEQHSRAELQLRTIYSSCVQCKRELHGQYVEQHSRAELQHYAPYYTAVVSKESWSQGHYALLQITSRTTATYHIPQLCPMNDCNDKRDSVTRTLRRVALTSRTTTTYHIQ